MTGASDKKERTESLGWDFNWYTVAAIAWLFGLFLQGLCFWSVFSSSEYDPKNDPLLHWAGMIGLGIGAVFLFRARRFVGALLSHDIPPGEFYQGDALRMVGTLHIAAGIGTFALTLLASLAPPQRLLTFPTVFRNMGFTIIPLPTAIALWLASGTVFLVLGLLARREAGKRPS